MSLTLERLKQALGGTISAGQLNAPGPGHSPRDRSMAVKLEPQAPDGFIVHSHSGDDALACKDYIRERLRLPAWKPNGHGPHEPDRRACVIAEYVYRLSDGSPYLKVKRLEPRSFPQFHWNGTEWSKGKPPGPKIPYRLPEMLAAVHDVVFLCEGEKDADTLTALGHVATSASEGAGKWTPDLNRWFKGRRVFVMEDNDEAGRKHAAVVADNLTGIAAEVRIVRLPGLKEKGDVTDWLEAGNDASRLVELCSRFPIHGQPTLITATAYRCIPPTAIPPREWLGFKHYIRKFVSATGATGGAGKTRNAIAEALTLCTGRPLLGIKPTQRVKVWIWNGEDPFDELQRQVEAARLHYQIPAEDIEGWLFLDSGRTSKIIIATESKDGAKIAEPVKEALVATIKANGIGAVILDPFVKTHRVSENDNGKIDLVATTFADIANDTNCSIELIHHLRKSSGGDVTVEDLRGAVSLLGAARSVRVMSPMTADEAKGFGIEDRRSFVRHVNGKVNLIKADDTASWLKFVSVSLGNATEAYPEGDAVGVVTAWDPPHAFEAVTTHHMATVRARVRDEQWRKSPQAEWWVGKLVAEVVGFDLDEPADLAKVKGVLKTWFKNGVLVEQEGQDQTRQKRMFVRPGVLPE